LVSILNGRFSLVMFTDIMFKLKVKETSVIINWSFWARDEVVKRKSIKR
jgi:hypothetical protein